MAVMVMVIGMAPAHAVPLDSSGPAPSPTAKVDKALRALVADGHKVRVNVTTRTRADLPNTVRCAGFGVDQPWDHTEPRVSVQEPSIRVVQVATPSFFPSVNSTIPTSRDVPFVILDG